MQDASSTPYHPLVFSHSAGINSDYVEACIDRLQSRPIKLGMQDFLRNIEAVLDLLTLPYALARQAPERALLTTVTVQAIVNVKRHRRDTLLSGDGKEILDAEVERLFKEKLAMEEVSMMLSEEASGLLSKMMSIDIVERGSRSLVYAGYMSTWTAFECLSKDIWIGLLNDEPTRFGHPSFRVLPEFGNENDGLSRKAIEIGLLARYGFDLRRSVGTILSARFDFTSAKGISRAYEAAFGKLEVIDRLRSDNRMKLLEATRNLIAHRAGIVDQEFTRVTGSPAKIGTYLEISATDLSHMANQTIEHAINIVSALDALLLEPA